MIAVTSQGMWSSSIISQVFKTASYAIYYYFKEEECHYQAKFFMFMLKEDALHRMLKLPQLSIMKRQVQKALYPICLDKKIDIPITKVDELTVENIDEKVLPKMVEDDLDLPFLYEETSLDENEYIRMRLISNVDWGTMDWSTGKPIDETKEPAYVDGVIIYIHGGGYICGSSASSRPTAYHYAMTTEYPVFSIDYRLAPGYKYPTPLSDCWQAYLWIIKYSEKYLKLKFGKVVLVGDSAGGNLILGVTSLSIQKECRIPDGVHPLYPSLATAHVHFSPSLLLALDDPVLNSSFCSFALNCYVTPELTNKNHYLMSPIRLPQEILAKYPKVRMIVAGLDPLRDDAIRFTRRLVNAEVDIHTVEYRYLTHCFADHDRPPYDIDDAKLAMAKSTEFLKELINPASEATAP